MCLKVSTLTQSWMIPSGGLTPDGEGITSARKVGMSEELKRTEDEIVVGHKSCGQMTRNVCSATSVVF